MAQTQLIQKLEKLEANAARDKKYDLAERLSSAMTRVKELSAAVNVANQKEATLSQNKDYSGARAAQEG